MIRVDILDRSPVFMLGLVQILRARDVRVLGTRTHPLEHLDGRVDVSLVDHQALPRNEMAAYVGIRARQCQVLLLDHHDDDVSDLMRVGASGVVRRYEPPEAILDAVRVVAAGSTWPGAATVAAADATCENPGRNAQLLSEREEQVLRQISCGLTHGQIARRLGISRHTVDTYVKRIRSKLGAGNKAELTRAAVLGDLGVDLHADR